MAAATFTNPPGLRPGSSRAIAATALKSGWISLILSGDRAQRWTCNTHSPVRYISESSVCCSSWSSYKLNREISCSFASCHCWNMIQGSGRFQLWSRSLVMNMHLCSQDIIAPSTQAEIVKTKWTTFSVYSRVILSAWGFEHKQTLFTYNISKTSGFWHLKWQLKIQQACFSNFMGCHKHPEKDSRQK